MPSIDERVVAMAFENAKFEQGVAQTMATLTKLDDSLKKIGQATSLGNIEKEASKVTLNQPMSALDKLKARFSTIGSGAADGISAIERAGSKLSFLNPLTALDRLQTRLGGIGNNAGQGFSEIERASSRVSLRGLNASLDSVTAKFSVLQGAATVALGNIASQASMKGAAFAKSFAIGPIVDGFKEYSTNLNSIQTILSNTRDSGGNLKTVNAALQELNTYSDKTIYNFSEMARNIGTFTAAGVQLKPATAAIKGIANLAAMSGSNSQQASTAMYQLSQAIAAGKVGLQDWNSVVNAGMGGSVFQKALMRTAENMGKLKDGAVQIDKATGKATVNGQSFRESIMAKPGQVSWLSSDVLTKTLSQFTGDMTDAQLASQGFNAAQIKSIQGQAKAAQQAATQVKTLPQVFQVARETIGSGWAQTFQLLFGDFGQAKGTFTELSNTINGFINKTSKARNELLKGFDKLGGRDVLIKGIVQAFKDLGAIIEPIKQAFRDIFPAKTSQGLFNTVSGFTGLMKVLMPSAATVDGLRHTFAGIFAVLHIGWTIVKDVAKVFFDLLGVVGKGSGGFLAFTGGIGDFLVAIDAALTKGGLLNTFFKTLSSFIQAPVRMLGALSHAILGLFGGADASKATAFGDSLHNVKDAAGPLAGVITFLTKAWQGLVDIFKKVEAFVSPFLDKIGQQFSNIAPAIADGIKNADFNSILQALQTTFLGGIFLVIKKALGGGLNVHVGVLDNINKSFGALTGNLQAMQQKVKAQAILLIAGAVGVLAGSTYVLSTIDPKRLSSALTAMAVGLGELMGAIKLMTSGLGFTGILTLPILAAGLIGVAASTVILAGAMKLFATMSWKDIAKGMAGVAGGLAAIGVGMKFLGPGTIIQGPAILALAIGLNILALAVKQFASLKWQDLARGLAGVLGAMIALIAPISEMGPQMLIAGPGLILLSVGMSMLAGAVSAFSAMKPEKMVQGLVGMSVALVGIGLAIGLMPPNLALQAAGLLIVSVALGAVAGAIGVMGAMKIENIIRGLTALAGVMLILALGLGAMEGTAPGSAALIAVGVALGIIAPTLAFLGMLSWTTIVKGLIAIAAVLGTLAIAGTLAGPGLSALGIAMLPLAGVFVLTAGAVFLFAKALALLGANGGKGITVMITALTAFVALLPTLVINFVKGLVSIVEEIAKLAPKVIVALGVVLDTIIAFVIQNAGKFAVAVGSLIDAAVVILGANMPKLIAAGAKIMLDILTGIDTNIPQIITRVASIVVKFLSGIASNAGRLTSAGASFLVSFLGGIAAQLPRVVTAVGTLIARFIGAIATQIPRIIVAGGGLITSFVTGLLSAVGRMVVAGIKVVLNLISGIAQALPRIVSAAASVITRFVSALAESGPRIVDAGYKALIRFLHGLATAIRENNKDLVDAGIDVAKAVVQGVVQGLGEIGAKLIKPVVERLFHALPGWARKVLGIHSPSTVFAEIGQNIVGGLAIGLGSMDPVLEQGITDPIRRMIAANKDVGAFGKFIGSEFKDGLTGGLWDDGKSASTKSIEGSFAALTTKLHEEQTKLHDAIKSDQDKLNQELDKKPKDQDAKLIAQLNQNLSTNRDILSQATRATGSLSRSLRDTQKDLSVLGDAYTAVSAKLDAAKTALDAATQARDEAFKSYRDQYNTLPDISTIASDAIAQANMTPEERTAAAAKAANDARVASQVNQVAAYKKSLQDQLVATQKYEQTLQQLRAAGLDDTTYKKLLAEGVKDQEFANQLLAGGQAAIAQINALDSQMLASSTQIAQEASANLYQAGVDAATGLVQGLQAKMGDIRQAMEDIAAEMIRALRRKLKIKSPSQVFMEVGKFSAQGMAYGIKGTSNEVVSAATAMGDSVVGALQNSMQRVNDVMSVGIDSNPKITPVLDLTNVRSGMKEISGISDISPVSSYGLATDISNGMQQQASPDPASTSNGPATVVNFEQNNFSPESLSAPEIYRQTKNQLSQVKSGLGLPPGFMVGGAGPK